MKKMFGFLIALLFVFGFHFSYVNAEEKSASVGEAKYQEKEVVEEYDLGYGVVEQKIIAESSSNLTGFSAAGSGGGGTNEPGRMYPQQVNILSVPSSVNVRVVAWVNQNAYGWGRGTVKDVIKSFEKSNPGWRVIAAINGDFFDINGRNPLPDTTSGAAICNGDVYKNVGSTNLGFTNSGDSNTIVGNKKIAFSEKYYLSIIDENYNITDEFEIDDLNPNIVAEGTYVFCSYPYFIDEELKQRGHDTVAIPEGSFVVQSPERCIPYVNRDYNTFSFFGKGMAEKSNATEIAYTQFAIYTTNGEIERAIGNAYMIRVQKNVIGDYADCDNVTGCGDILVNEGEGVVHNNKERHPRTIVGVKEDGTILMITVDGRQPDAQMYGMTLDELSSLLKAYDCVEGYNLDGGGSTTMIIRQDDELLVLNSPSDGAERRDANALLVVVPEFTLKVSEVMDTSLVVSAPAKFKGLLIENIIVKVNGHEYTLIDSLMIENLNPEGECIIQYEYDRTYNGEKVHVIAEDIKIKMGKQLPIVKELKYQYTGNTLTIKYDIEDISNCVSFATLYYTTGSVDLDLSKKEVIINNIRSFDVNDLELTLFIELNSETTSSTFVTLNSFTQYIEEISDNPIAPNKSCGVSSVAILPFLFSFSIILIVFRKKD